MPPTIQTYDPLTAASEAVGSWVANKRQAALDEQAKAHADKLDTRADQDLQLKQNKYQHDVDQDATNNARLQAGQELAARTEADRALHQARADALAEAKQHDVEVKSDRDFAIAVKKINDTYALEKAKLKNARDIAEIRAQATQGAASIRAAATVQSANIHAGATIGAAHIRDDGANVRAKNHDQTQRDLFTQKDLTTQRGQDLTSGGRRDATTASNQRALMTATLRLSLSKGAPKQPTAKEDPKFGQALNLFVNGTPAQRDEFLSHPNVPAATRTYLQALSPILTTAPSAIPVPTTGDGGDEDEE